MRIGYACLTIGVREANFKTCILKNANDEGDFATVSFLQWFVTEQVEEEANASSLVTKIKMVCENPSALYLFDQELAQRVFVTEAGN